MSNEMQEYMLSHCQAVKMAETALQGYMDCIDNPIYVSKEDYTFIMDWIENPPEIGERMKALLNKTPCWERNDTEHLKASSVNEERLKESIGQLEGKRKIVEVSMDGENWVEVGSSDKSSDRFIEDSLTNQP